MTLTDLSQVKKLPSLVPQAGQYSACSVVRWSEDWPTEWANSSGAMDEALAHSAMASSMAAHSYATNGVDGPASITLESLADLPRSTIKKE